MDMWTDRKIDYKQTENFINALQKYLMISLWSSSHNNKAIPVKILHFVQCKQIQKYEIPFQNIKYAYSNLGGTF